MNCLHWAQSLWEADGSSASQEIPAKPKVKFSYSQEPATSPYAEPDRFKSVPAQWFLLRYVLVLSSRLRLGLSSGLFPSGFPTRMSCARIISFIRATCANRLIHPDLATRIVFGEEYKSWSTSSCNFRGAPRTPSLVGPNAFLSTLLLNIQSVFSFSVRDRVAHPYKTRGRIIVLCVLRLVFLNSKGNVKDSSRRTNSLNSSQDVMIHVGGGQNFNVPDQVRPRLSETTQCSPYWIPFLVSSLRFIAFRNCDHRNLNLLVLGV